MLRLKRFIALLTVFSVLLLASCAQEAKSFEPTAEPTPTVSGDMSETAVISDVMYINGDAVKSDEFYYQLISVISAYEYYAGESIDWSGEIEGKPAEEFFLDETVAAVVRFRAIEYGAEELGISLDAEELSAMEADIETQINDLGGREAFEAALSEQSLTEDTYRYLIYVPQLYYKMYEHYYGDGGENHVSDAELREYYEKTYITTQHIMAALFSEEGEYLTFEEQDAAAEQLRSVRELALAGEDFYSLMQEHSEDEWMTTESITFSALMMPESYFSTASALEENGISEIFQVEDMLVFVKRLPIDDAYFEDYKSELYDEYATGLFDEYIAKWAEKLNLEYAEDYTEPDVQAIYSEYFAW